MSWLDNAEPEDTRGRFNFRCVQTKKLMMEHWVKLAIVARAIAQYRNDFKDHTFKLVSIDDEGNTSG